MAEDLAEIGELKSSPLILCQDICVLMRSMFEFVVVSIFGRGIAI